MATIDQIADGEEGIDVRAKLNQVHDQIVEVSAAYAAVQADDVIIVTAPSPTPFEIDLLSVSAAPGPTTVIKQLMVFNLAASDEDVTVAPFGSETIDGLSSVVLVPGTCVTLVPSGGDWVTQNLGVVDSVGGGTNINVSGLAEDPVVNLDAAITGVSVNGVTLSDVATSGTFLEGDGNYSLAVTSVGGGTNITNSGTPNDPVMDLDSIITGMTVNGVDLTDAGDTFEYLAEDGQYTVPTGNIVEANTNYTQLVRDDVIIASSGIGFDIDLIIVSSAVKAITIRNDGTATVTINANVVDNIDGSATVALLAGTSLILVPSSTNDWLEVGEAGLQSVNSGTNISVDNTDPDNPIINLPPAITSQSVNGVTLTNAGAPTDFLAADGTYRVPTFNGALLSTLTVQVSNEADIIAAFGAGPLWDISGKNVQWLEDFTITSGNSFTVTTANATIIGVDRNVSSITGNSTVPLIDFTADSGADVDLQLLTSNISIIQEGSGPLVRVDGTRFIFQHTTGVLTGGDIELLNGQFLGLQNGELDGGGSIIQGDGTAANPGVEFIVIAEAFLLITDLFADNQRLMEFMPNSNTQRLTCDAFSLLINPDFGLPQRTGGIGMYFHETSKVRIFNYMGGGFSPFHPTSREFVVEDPASIKFGLLGGNTFEGAGELYECRPNVSSTFAMTSTSVRSVGFNETGLLSADTSSNNLFQYTGLSGAPTSTILSPSGNPTGVGWHRGNLLSTDGSNDTMYLHDGFSTAILSSFIIGGVGFLRGIVSDGTNIMICDEINQTVTVFAGFSSTILKTIDLSAIPISPTDLTYDGVNIILTDQGADLVYVMKGISNIVQYSFSIGGIEAFGGTVTDTGFVATDFTSGDFQVIDSFVTFDHSSPTWEVMGNVGEQEQIKVDPIDTALWTTGNSGTLSDAGAILTLTNGAAAAGLADFDMNCVVGHTYRVTNGYTPGTSVSATFYILDPGLSVITSETVSVAGDVVLTFIATDPVMTFRFQNTSIISAEDSILTSLSQIDESYKIVESSDKGGSIFSNTAPDPISPALVQDVLSDISDGGTDIFYGPFSKREKSLLNDETNGAIKITSIRDRGQSFQGSIVAQTLAASPGEYQLLVTINGEPQEDSVGSNVWSNNNEIQTITTQLITRDVTDTDVVKLQIRPIGHAVNLGPLRCSLSHTE